MTTMNVLNSAGAVVAVEKPLAPGRTAAAVSRPVALSTEDLAAVNAINTLLTTQNTYLDGLEALATTLNALMTTQAGYLDGLESGSGSILAKIGLGQRQLGTIKSGTWTAQAATSYVAQNCIGGYITVATGLAAGTVITPIARLKVLKADYTSSAGISWAVFDAAPAGTFADNTAISAVAGDLAKMLDAAAASVVDTAAGGFVKWAFTGPRVTVDGSGNFYAAFWVQTTTLLVGAQKMMWEVDALY